MQTRDVGEPVTLTSQWWNANREPVDPATIDLTVTHPNGDEDTYAKGAMTQGATTDEWQRVIVPDAEGLWRYTFVGTVDGFTVEQSGSVLVGFSLDGSGPCEPWTTWEDVAECPGAPTGLDAPAQELAIDLASEVLFNLTGRVYTGVCERTRSICFACCGCYPSVCSCVPLGSIDLGRKLPVWGVWDVKLDGVTLPPTAYTVIGRRYLTRLDGQVWPSGYNVNNPAAFRLTYAAGRPIPAGGRNAARVLAVEFAKACANDKTCALPQRITNVTREGVSYTIIDSMQILDEGRTGLTLVDLWVATDRKGRRRPRMLAPGMNAGRSLP